MLILKIVKMKSKIIRFFVIAGFLTATVTSCYKDDFNELQKQVDELEQKVAENTQVIQEQIMTQIADLQSQLTTLTNQSTEAFDQVQSQLDSISSDVENNAKTVYYGNLIADEEYAAYEEAGADVVTGKVVITTVEQAEIVNNCRWIGADLITEIGSLEGIQNVGGNVIVNSDTVSVIELKGMLTIGGNFEIPESSNLTSVIADELIAITGEFRLDKSTSTLETVSMKSFELVGTVKVNAEDNSNTTGRGLITLDWNSPVIAGDLDIEYLDNAETSVGDVLGDVYINDCSIKTFTFTGTRIKGDFTFSQSITETINAEDIVTISGNITLVNNSNKIYDETQGDFVYVGLKTLNFKSLSTLNGDIYLRNNNALRDIFNSIINVGGNITISARNTDLDVIAFESLTSIGNGGAKSIRVYGKMQSFKGFNELIVLGDPDNHEGTIILAHDGNKVNYAEIKSVNAFNKLTDVAVVKLGSFINADQVECFTSLTNAYKLYIDAYKASVYAGSYNIPALANVDFVYINGAVKTVTMPSLTSVSTSISIDSYDVDLLVDFPELTEVKSIYGIRIIGKKSGGIITLDMPKLASLTSFEYNDGSNKYIPKELNAALPSVQSIKNVKLDFSVGVVNASSVLSGLNEVTGYIKLSYLGGQDKLCGLSTILNAIAGSKKLYLYKDGSNSAIPDDQEAAEVSLLTSGC
jgi:hypothetical protein